MTVWDGKERRKDMPDSTVEFRIQLMKELTEIKSAGVILQDRMTHLSERVEHANNNTKAFKVLIDEDIQDLQIAIQGDETKGIVGLSAKVGKTFSALTEHITQDRWAYGIMISIMLAILGWTVFVKS